MITLCTWQMMNFSISCRPVRLESQGSNFALGGNDKMYLYWYAGMGEWAVPLATDDPAL